MKILSIAFLSLFTASVAFADRIDVPLSCYPKEIQAKFEKKGKKLDLSANDRDENSWGFIESKGSSYSIYTYRALEIPKDLEEIQKIVLEK